MVCTRAKMPYTCFWLLPPYPIASAMSIASPQRLTCGSRAPHRSVAWPDPQHTAAAVATAPSPLRGWEAAPGTMPAPRASLCHPASSGALLRPPPSGAPGIWNGRPDHVGECQTIKAACSSLEGPWQVHQAGHMCSLILGPIVPEGAPAVVRGWCSAAAAVGWCRSPGPGVGDGTSAAACGQARPCWFESLRHHQHYTKVVLSDKLHMRYSNRALSRRWCSTLSTVTDLLKSPSCSSTGSGDWFCVV